MSQEKATSDRVVCAAPKTNLVRCLPSTTQRLVEEDKKNELFSDKHIILDGKLGIVDVRCLVGWRNALREDAERMLSKTNYGTFLFRPSITFPKAACVFSCRDAGGVFQHILVYYVHGKGVGSSENGSDGWFENLDDMVKDVAGQDASCIDE